MMRRNIGFTDRLIRSLLGICLLFAYGHFGSTIGVSLSLAGALAILSAAFGRCLLYDALGIATTAPADLAAARARSARFRTHR